MDTDVTTDLLQLRDQAVSLQDETSAEQAVIEEAKEALKRKNQLKYKLIRQYWDERVVAIVTALEGKNKAVCAACKKVKPIKSMRCIRESNFATRSDCSYSQWTEYWSRDLPLCMKCSQNFDYSVSVREGKPVGKQLLAFDVSVHNDWLKSDGEFLNSAEAQLKLGLPPI